MGNGGGTGSPDGGTNLDGGSTRDGGTTRDGGMNLDGGTNRDGGASLDGGAYPDGSAGEGGAHPPPPRLDASTDEAGGSDGAPPNDAPADDDYTFSTDAACTLCSGGACCQQVELAVAAATAMWVDGTTLYWTTNQPTSDGGANGAIEATSIPVEDGVSTLNSGPGHAYGAIAGSSTDLYFVDQTAASVLCMPKQDTPNPSVFVNGAVAGIAVEEVTADGGADGGATGYVYFGTATSVSWVTFPLAGTPVQLTNFAPSQLAIDATSVYAIGPHGAVACPLAPAGGACTTLVSGLASGQGIFPDATTNVWITDLGTDATNGAVYKCPKGGGCGAPFASGRNHPFAIVADDDYVYWTEAFQGGPIMRCPVAGCGSGPEAVAHGFETPTVLVQDATRLYWTDVNNISMLVK